MIRSADGTTILSSLSNRTLATYIPPPDLLTPPAAGPHNLKPYATHKLPEPALATALLPSYNLQSPSTCLALASVRYLPLRLFSTLYDPDITDPEIKSESRPTSIVASYPLVSPTTEVHLGMYSLAFGSDNWVYAGTDGMIAAFDLNRQGEGPAYAMRTGNGRRRVPSGAKSVTSAYQYANSADANHLRGIVSALSVNSDKVMAAGTFGRSVGLYGGLSREETIATFALNDKTDGTGITQVLWSSCSKYLCVVERGSDGIGVWDVRSIGQRLAWLNGRKAKTPQRLTAEVFDGDVWAGGTDGHIRSWERLGMEEGQVEPTWSYQVHEDAVPGIGWHSSGSALATCSGQRHSFESNAVQSDSGSDSESKMSSGNSVSASDHSTTESSLRLWAT